MDKTGDRNQLGRFNAGHAPAGSGGGRPRHAITGALRRLSDPDKIAAFLLGVIEDKEASTKDRIEAAKLVLERLEGKAVAVVHRTTHTAPSLPAGWAAWTPIERGRWLDQLQLAPGDEDA